MTNEMNTFMWLLLIYWWYFQSITVYNKKGQNSLRRLFHLTRFYQQYQSKYTILTNIVATYLNKQPMKRQEIHKTREQCVSKGVWSNHALVIYMYNQSEEEILADYSMLFMICSTLSPYISLLYWVPEINILVLWR